MSLIGEISVELRSLENVNANRYLGWVPSLNKAFSEQNINGKWQTFISKVNDHTVNYLSNTADILEARIRRFHPDLSSLEELLESTDDLKEKIVRSSLPEHVKQYMVKKISEINLAVEEYRISGSGPIVENIEAIFGHVILDREFREASRSEDAAPFWTFIKRAALIITMSLGILQIPHEVEKYLPNSVQQEAGDISKQNGARSIGSS